MKARRATLVLGLFGVLAGAGLLTAGFALAAGVGSEPGNLILSAASGSLTSTPTWKTTDACPSNFQTSANVVAFTAPGGARVTSISGTINSGLTAPFGPTISGSAVGTLDGNVASLFAFAGITPSSGGGTLEWVVECWSGPGGTGTSKATQSIFVSVAAGASTYTTSATAPSGTPGGGMSSSMSPAQSKSPSPTASASASASASDSKSAATSRSSTPAATSSLSPPLISTDFPSGAPATGVGGSSGSGPDRLLIALGATVLVASLAAMGVVIWRQRPRALAWDDGRHGTGPGGR